MTREEQIKLYLKERNIPITSLEANSIIEGVEWADKTIIDKACDWLLKGGYFVNNTETINDFKRAMEE